MNPPPSARCRPPLSRAKGTSKRSPSGGTIRPSPTTPSTISPIHRSASWGRPRALRSHDPISVNTEKLSTSPPTTANGRRRRRALTVILGAGRFGRLVDTHRAGSGSSPGRCRRPRPASLR